MGNEYSGNEENMSWNARKSVGPVGELRKVRVGDIGRKTIKQYWHEVYNGVEPVHKNKFDEYMYKDDFHKYDWQGLKNSLLENGYDINKYSPITVRPSHEDFKYFIIDGQHRAFLLREIFGEDHMIDVDVRDTEKSKERKPIIHYIEFINEWTYPVYFLIFHTIPIAVSIILFYLIQKYLPDNQLYKTLKKGKLLTKISDFNERLYTMLLTTINNTQMIAYIVTATIVSIHILITDLYGVVAIVILTNIIKYIISRFKEDDK
tara:strand:- start:143 stop:928 length:786 start_codon:yes stop_codon:yes gene_type:complete